MAQLQHEIARPYRRSRWGIFKDRIDPVSEIHIIMNALPAIGDVKIIEHWHWDRMTAMDYNCREIEFHKSANGISGQPGKVIPANGGYNSGQNRL
jgi:hypothetical protein